MIEQIRDLLNKAIRPIIYAGHGCTLHRVRFERFADDLGIPVMLSWRAIDMLPDDHSLFAGRPGLIAQPEANKRLWDADLVLIMGARMDDSLTCYNLVGFCPKAFKIVVDVDKAELDRLPEDWIKVEMDCGQFMKELDEVLE